MVLLARGRTHRADHRPIERRLSESTEQSGLTDFRLHETVGLSLPASSGPPIEVFGQNLEAGLSETALGQYNNVF